MIRIGLLPRLPDELLYCTTCRITLKMLASDYGRSYWCPACSVSVAGADLESRVWRHVEKIWPPARHGWDAGSSRPAAAISACLLSTRGAAARPTVGFRLHVVAKSDGVRGFGEEFDAQHRER